MGMAGTGTGLTPSDTDTDGRPADAICEKRHTQWIVRRRTQHDSASYDNERLAQRQLLSFANIHGVW